VNVSIVIPTYYRIKDLSELFNSILKQTVKPLEVIVVDDTPTSAIEELCEAYRCAFKRCNIKLVYVKNYRGQSAAIARNVGASIARGEVILFLDSDVILHPTYIEKILEVFNIKKGALGAQGWILLKVRQKDLYLWNPLHKFFSLLYLSKNSCKLFEYPYVLTRIINCEYLSGANMAYRREVFDKLGLKFDENLKGYSYMEDLLFSHTLYKMFPKSLYITPYAKLIHKWSKEGRTEKLSGLLLETQHMLSCKKYVLMKLFGVRGLIYFSRQYFGLLFFGILRRVAQKLKVSIHKNA